MSVLVDMNDLDLAEISGVPNPMNEHSDAALTKAAEADAGEEGGRWHSHEMARDGDDFAVAMSAGHSYDVDGAAITAAAAAAAAPVMKGQTEMSEVNKETGGAAPESGEFSLDKIAGLIKGVSEQVAAQGARTDRLEKVLALNAEQRVVFDQLSKEAQETYLEASEADRGVLSAQAQKAAADAALGNREVWKSADGMVYTEADDPRLVAMAKEREEMKAELQKDRESMRDLADSLRQGNLEKRAQDELPYAFGPPAAKAALLDAVDTIRKSNPELGEQVNSLVQGMNTAAGYNWGVQGTEALKGVGSGGDVMKQAAEAQLIAKGTLSEHLVELRKMADDYHQQHPEMTRAKAYQIQSSTQKGRELLMEHYANMPVDMV